MNPAAQAEHFQNLISIGIALSSERDPTRLMERILLEAKTIANADGGTLYLLPDDAKEPRLEFAIIRNTSLDIALGGCTGQKITFPSLPLITSETGQQNHANVATHVANTGRCVRIEDAYHDERFDFSGTRAFDAKTGYRSKSFFTLPLKNHDDDVIGVLQLINAQDQDGQVVPFGDEVAPLVEALASLAAITLENQQLFDAQKTLLEAFIKVIATAIDSKSAHTSGHCQRVPVLTEMITRAVCEHKEGPMASFDLTEEEWFELHIAGWMHDCGKLTTPNHILDKASKLDRPHDRISEVAARFAVKLQEVEISHLRGEIDAPTYRGQIAGLKSDLEFLRTANKGGEFMGQDAKDRVHSISKRLWTDSDGVQKPLLSDEEVYNLCIERGTLTAEERQIINDHIVVTIEMLNQLPFPKNLRRVPEYAGGHHEKMDGTGYPKGLTREQMSIPARVMAVADIFEALTARDRPYKEPMKFSLAFTIMQRMCRNNHIDPDIWDIFLRSNLWKDYARDHCIAGQCDIESAEEYRVPEMVA